MAATGAVALYHVEGVTPEAKKVSLIHNYRSTQPILDSAYRLIQYNNPERFEVKAGIDKKLTASFNR